jgi:hypothetical protein
MIYVDDENDPPQKIVDDAKQFLSKWFALSDDDHIENINAAFDAQAVGVWELGRLTSALVQIYDLVTPLDAETARTCLERLRRIAGALLDNRDDKRLLLPFEPSRNKVMPAWGGVAKDRDCRWNTDPVIAGLFTYAMAAFARRVANPAFALRMADNPKLYGAYPADAIRFVRAAIETYEGFRPELHLTDSDPEAYYVVPSGYANLLCNRNDMSDDEKEDCRGWRDAAGKNPISYNENLAMMKALAEVALAADSALYRSSADATPERLRLATEEMPLVVAKNVAFFTSHLREKRLSDGTPYFEWNHQLPGKPGIQDTGHAQFELDSLAVILDDRVRLNLLLARAGRSERVALRPALFIRFANTFLRKVWHYDFQNASGPRNVLAGAVDGKGNPSDTDNKNVECAGWIPLAQFDPWVWIRCRDTTFHAPPPEGYVREDNHAALLRYRRFNQKTVPMNYLTDFACQNWLITPAALAYGESPPASIHDQKWLLVLSGVVIADLKGDSQAGWLHETVSFTPDMSGPDDPSSTSGPLNWAISRYSIPKPPGSAGAQYLIRFSVEECTPCASLGAIFNQGQSIDSGFAVDAWRPNHFGSGTDVLTSRPVDKLFTGINVDLAVRDTDAWLYRLAYNITLVGKVVFVAPAF